MKNNINFIFKIYLIEVWVVLIKAKKFFIILKFNLQIMKFSRKYIWL